MKSTKVILILGSSIYAWTVLLNTGALLSQKDVLQSLTTESWQLKAHDWDLRRLIVEDYLFKIAGTPDPMIQVSYERTNYLMEVSLQYLGLILDNAKLLYRSEVYGGLDNLTEWFHQRRDLDRQLLRTQTTTNQSHALLEQSYALSSKIALAAEDEAIYATNLVESSLANALSQAGHLRTVSLITIALCAALEVLGIGAHVRTLRKANVGWVVIVGILLLSAGASVEESVSRIKITDELRDKLSYIRYDALPAVIDIQKWLYYDAMSGASVHGYALAYYLVSLEGTSQAYATSVEALQDWENMVVDFVGRKSVAEATEMLQLYGVTIHSWREYSNKTNTAILMNPPSIISALRNITYLSNLAQYEAATEAVTVYLRSNLAATLESTRDTAFQLVHLSVVLTVLALVVLVALEEIVKGLKRNRKLAVAALGTKSRELEGKEGAGSDGVAVERSARAEMTNVPR
ncbi:hypothetical protein HDU93_002126 [Gonapodya sp. JEL0774]|nr:hypothetical protein HDU93_002126 [Gonapodya sp. JEL0774]